MAIIKGNASFIRFSVVGTLPDNALEFIAKRVATFSFKDIDDTYDEYSIGWVSIGNMFDANFAYASRLVGEYVVLTLRIDERKVSPAILKKFQIKEEERIRKERQLPKLSRAAKLQIKERIRTELLRKAIPAPSTFELLWNLSTSVVFFFSTNKQAQSLLEDYFKECFGLFLHQQIPYTLAEALLSESQRPLLENLSPEILV